MEQPRRVSLTVSSGRGPTGRSTFSSVRKTQSYSPRLLRDSFRLNCPSILRQYFSTTCCGVRRRCSASRTISSLLIQTNPGPPVQQLPHCEQVNFNPSAYHGPWPLFFPPEDWTTSNFIAPIV